MARTDYESQVEQVFSTYAKATGRALAAEAKASLRKHHRVFEPDPDRLALLELQNTLEAAAIVRRVEELPPKAPAREEAAKPKRPRGRPTKCFDRRYRIVVFVTERLPKSGRPDWKRMVSEWNATYPLDQVNRNLLKVEYNRALREWDIVFQYLVATHDDGPFREMLKRVKGPTMTLTGDAALEWLRNHGGNGIRVVERTTYLKDKGAK